MEVERGLDQDCETAGGVPISSSVHYRKVQVLYCSRMLEQGIKAERIAKVRIIRTGAEAYVNKRDGYAWLQSSQGGRVGA